MSNGLGSHIISPLTGASFNRHAAGTPSHDSLRRTDYETPHGVHFRCAPDEVRHFTVGHGDGPYRVEALSEDQFSALREADPSRTGHATMSAARAEADAKNAAAYESARGLGRARRGIPVATPVNRPL